MNRSISVLMDYHNRLVRSDYKSYDERGFLIWLSINTNYEDKYIEIASNETLSGHAEILDLSCYMHLLTE